ncbi:MAG: heme-binding domain-containing protein [Pyrinomonadaceae bacterium]
MRIKLKWFAVIVGVLFIGLQLTSPERSNPQIDEAQTLESTSTVTPEVSAILVRSCNDCHSNETNWRWYSHVAPISNFTADHVKEGRLELNFSEWGKYKKRTKQTRLTAICHHVEKRSMPLDSYAFIHRDASLSSAEIALICRWTEQEAQRLATDFR